MNAWYHWDEDDLILKLHIQPKARKDEWVGPYGGRFKIRIQAPPVDGKANSHLLAFLAEQFGVPKRNVVLLSGQSGRHKQLRIQKPLKLPSQLDAN